VTLKPRQEQLLRVVVEEYIASGSPVGSKYLSQHHTLGAAPSTLRMDMARLEELGLLDHPHTSAGRLPTDAGYRHYADAIVRERHESRTPLLIELDRARVQSEVDSALEETAEALSRMTELLAIVSAPALGATSVRHVEVLALQPQVVMVVVITAAGNVIKRVFSFAHRVDPGLAEFARVYLNERLTGRQLGGRLLEAVFTSGELGPSERDFMARLRPAFDDVIAAGTVDLHVGGTARLVERLAAQGESHLNDVIAQLEERFSMLELLSDALRNDDVYLRIGHEMREPSLQACSLVAANYGVANRNLGTVSVLGPTRMDYQDAIAAVRGAAGALSRFLEEIW
jgi:heat-inducible transcriptional repressor